MIKKSVTITEQQEAWIQSQLATGNYASDSELIREAIREKQARMTEAVHLRAALIAAEQGGVYGELPDGLRKTVKDAVALRRKARG